MAHYRIISLYHLQRDLDVVIRNLDRLGFWTDRMADVDVYLAPLLSLIPDQALGYAKDGNIYIPSTGLSRLFNCLGQYNGLRDVIRHEYGHALADCYPKIIRRNRKFMSHFGARYDSDTAFLFDPDLHLTPYGATSPAEDFAECFMAFLKFGGRIERFHRRPGLYAKLKWIRTLPRSL